MMTEHEYKAFKGLMTRIAGVLGKPTPDDDTAEFAFAVINHALPDVTISELTRAAFLHLRGSRFHPTPSDLIDAVNDERDRNVPETPRAIESHTWDVAESRAAFEACRARIRLLAGRVGRPMPSADPWQDDVDQLAALTRRDD